MDVRIIESEVDPEQYNKLAFHALQSWEWGEAKKELVVEVIRIGEFNKDILLYVYQLTLHPIPYTPYKIAYLPRSRFPSLAVFEFLKELGKKHRLIFIKIEPEELYGTDFEKKIEKSKYNIVRSPHPLFGDWTIVVDLKKTDDEIMKNMKQKTRYNIKLAERKGVVIKEESNEKGLKKFMKLYFDTCRRQKYFGHDENYHKVIWKHLKNNIAHILIAYYNNEPLAAFELFKLNKTLYYPYGGTSTEHRNVMAANLLMWEAIKLGRKLGAEKFDMWNSLSPEHKGNQTWEGFTRFKEGYGGEHMHMAGGYDFIINPIAFKMFNIINKLRNFYLLIRSSLPR